MKIEIPTVSRDGSLLSRLLAIIIVGFDQVLEKESQLYLRLLVRLIDKGFDEYTGAREYLLEEVRTEDKLAYRMQIINHLENCVNALSRANKILNTLTNGIIVRKKNLPSELIRKNLKLINLIDNSILQILEKKSISDVRNRIEHLEEDIYLDTFKEGIFLDIDPDYKKICINNNCVSLDH